MAQLWQANNGYMGTPTLSQELRNAVQPLQRFTQYADVEEAIGTGRGDTYQWNVYGDTTVAGNINGLNENSPMPETGFATGQGSITIKEFGNSVPYSGKYDDLSEHSIKEIIQKTMKNDAAKTLDRVAHAQFDATLLRLTSTSATAATLTDTGTASGNHTNVLSTSHVKLIADTMQERNIPTFDGENYCAVMRPTTLRPILNELEALHVNTPEGWARVMNGEKGNYEGIRFVTQTNIPTEGWGVSDAAYFFGADTVTEAVSIPLEMRGKIPDDFGRSKGIAWYSLCNYGITHADATSAETKKQARIIKWDSVA